LDFLFEVIGSASALMCPFLLSLRKNGLPPCVVSGDLGSPRPELPPEFGRFFTFDQAAFGSLASLLSWDLPTVGSHRKYPPNVRSPTSVDAFFEVLWELHRSWQKDALPHFPCDFFWARPQK